MLIIKSQMVLARSTNQNTYRIHGCKEHQGKMKNIFLWNKQQWLLVRCQPHYLRLLESGPNQWLEQGKERRGSISTDYTPATEELKKRRAFSVESISCHQKNISSGQGEETDVSVGYSKERGPDIYQPNPAFTPTSWAQSLFCFRISLGLNRLPSPSKPILLST